MPTYEYECRQCGLRFEKRQLMTDRPLVWRRINRPHKAIPLPMVLDGIRAFAKAFALYLILGTKRASP